MPLFPARTPRPSQLATRRGGIGSHPAAHVGAAAPQTPPPPAGAAASQLLKRYRPLETRATGGFGSVEICLDSRLQRRVAIKRMPLASPFERASAATTAAALAEARTASMLQHPNIVQVIDFTYDAAYAYLVMEYVDGLTLEEFLAQVDNNSLTYDETATIADALVQALAYAHENGVLHLDIKPANVLIDRSGHVKLADFGMATLASAAGFGGARGGTIGYMPPEQLNGDEVDERTDIFALAAVLYEALCATAPFRAGTPADSLEKIERGVLYPSDLLPDLPESAEEALLCALSPEPSDRMTSVDAFADLFLAQLGNARPGRASLASIIARLTSDEDPTTGDTGAGRAARTWELDPAEGILGSRWSRARRGTVAAVAGAASTVMAWAMLATVQAMHPVARAITALGIGITAAVAPAIGSALAIIGWLVTIVSNTPFIAVVPVAALGFAVGVTWWLVWGRAPSASSAVFCLAAALAVASGSGSALAGIATGVAGFFLPAPRAAASMAAGAVFSHLLAATLSSGGALGIGDAVAVLATPAALASIVVLPAAAAATSWLLDKTWQRYQDSRGARLAAAACVMPAMGTLLSSAPALAALAHPMEITAAPLGLLLTMLGAAALSSIIVWLATYTLGYKRTPAEGDRP